jgi:glycosyltransferase involved in cell wall biosynthesis
VDSATRPHTPDERIPAAPLVSIVVPVFNGAKYLRESLDSLFRQTYTPHEIIVCDDASTDETPEVIASYADRVRALSQTVNRGIYANANDGIAAARGEFIAVYHADDVYDSRIVERSVTFLRDHPQAGAVFCLAVFVDAKNREYARPVLPPEVRGRALLDYRTVVNGLLRRKNRFLMCPGTMVRSSVHREVGTYRQEQFRNTSDLEMWLRIARRHPLGLLEEYLFRYRHTDLQSSRRYHKLRTTPENFFRIVDLYLAEDGPALATPEALLCYEAHRAEDQLKIGVAHYILNDLPAARAALRAIRAATIVRGRTVQRWRLLVVLGAFRVLARLPRLTPVADLFFRRWFEKRTPQAR